MQREYLYNGGYEPASEELIGMPFTHKVLKATGKVVKADGLAITVEFDFWTSIKVFFKEKLSRRR